MNEDAIKTTIRKHYGNRDDLALFTNPCGNGWVGSNAVVRGDVALVKNPRRVEYGLIKGSSDVIGIQRLRITQEMVGRTIGRFVAFEIKTLTGQLSPEQSVFIANVKALGAAAGVVRSVADAEKLLQEV